jgi:hypothetical protein
VWVTNFGTAATARTITVTVNLPRGIVMVQGGKGTFWQCFKGGSGSTCTRRAMIGAGSRTMITATVRVTARARKTLYATATVNPYSTPRNGSSTDKVVIRRG